VYGDKETALNKSDSQEWSDLLLKSEVCNAFQAYERAKVLGNSLKVNPYFLVVCDKRQAIGSVVLLKKKIVRRNYVMKCKIFPYVFAYLSLHVYKLGRKFLQGDMVKTVFLAR